MTNEMVLKKKSNLVMPSHYVELDREEMMYVEGGGRFTVTVSCTAGGLVSGFTSGVITGFLTGFFSGLGTKFGKYGGVIGALIGAAVGALLGAAVSTYVNKILAGGGSSVTLISIWVPFVKYTYDIDIAEYLSATIGAIGGGSAGVAAATGIGYLLGAT